MNQGLEILIARTKTHPEEFFGWETGGHIASRWITMMENFTKHMTDEEKEKWQEAKTGLDEWYANKRRDDFTEAVMKELLMRNGEEEINEAVRPAVVTGVQRYNHNTLQMEVYDGKQWIPMTMAVGGGGGGGGSVAIKTPAGTHTFNNSGTFTLT